MKRRTKNNKSAPRGASDVRLVAGGRSKRLSPDNDVREALVAGAGNHRLSLIAEYDVPYRKKA